MEKEKEQRKEEREEREEKKRQQSAIRGHGRGKHCGKGIVGRGKGTARALWGVARARKKLQLTMRTPKVIKIQSCKIFKHFLTAARVRMRQ